MATDTPPIALTIAGSDSGGGAGIQADLKTFAALGLYGTSAITAVTAQNTRGVTAVQEIDLDVIAAQIDAVVTDMHPNVVKTGMLASPDIVRLVAAKAKQHGFGPLVVDPVMVAATGARLMQEEAINAVKSELIPLATIVTPNGPEAAALTGRPVKNLDDMREAARAIHGLGAKYVVVKGGHIAAGDEKIDVLFDGSRIEGFRAPRIETGNTHGTGCTFGAAIASYLALGRSMSDAVGEAKQFVWKAMRASYSVGEGRGPLNHMFHLWES